MNLTELLTVDNIIVAAYLLVILLVGMFAGRGTKDLKNFAVAQRSYSWFVVFATLSASFIGGGFSIGNAEKVFLVGIGNVFALWGFSLKEILVAKFIAPKMTKYADAISVGDIMGVEYGRVAKIVTGVFSMALCAGIVGAQVGGMGLVFNVFLGMPKTTGILIGCGIVITYSTVGGMKAVVTTDVIQFIVLVIGLPLTLVFALIEAGGWSAVTSTVPADHLTGLGGLSVVAFASLFLTFLFGETLVPPYVQRLLIGKETKDTVKGTYLSGLLSIPFFLVTGLLGLVALSLDPSIEASAALPSVMHAVLPVGLKGIVIAGVISIVMSSADSFLNGASVAFVNDIVEPIRGKELSPRSGLYLAMAANAVVGVLAVVFAIRIESVLDILIYAYNFWAPIILVPLTLAILGRRKSVPAFIAGGTAGLAATLIWNQLGKPLEIDGLVIGVLFNWLVFSVIASQSQK